MLCALLGTSALVAAVPALAADNAVSPSGLMQFRNVQVQSATPAQVAAEAATLRSNQPGMRAFLDPVTGELRDPTTEEAAAMNHFSRAKAASNRASTAVALASARNSTIFELDDSFMANAVVKRDASGKLHGYCVDRHDDALDLLRQPAMEVRNDR